MLLVVFAARRAVAIAYLVHVEGLAQLQKLISEILSRFLLIHLLMLVLKRPSAFTGLAQAKPSEKAAVQFENPGPPFDSPTDLKLHFRYQAKGLKPNGFHPAV